MPSSNRYFPRPFVAERHKAASRLVLAETDDNPEVMGRLSTRVETLIESIKNRKRRQR
jgi:hypothetical protein